MMRNSSNSRMSYNYMENVVSSCSTGNDNNQKLKDRLGECDGVVVRSVGRVISDDAEQLISTWPPKHYTCNFCKRRFKSAQALGGHMNVHRRARALLRSHSNSISPVPISSSPCLHPTNINVTTAQQNDHESRHFIFITNPNPIPNWHLQNTHHRSTINNPTYPYLHSLIPIMSITSVPSASMHVNPHSAAASACKHGTGSDDQYYYLHPDQDKLLTGLMTSKNTNQDDALGNGSIISNSTDQQDIDLELHL